MPITLSNYDFANIFKTYSENGPEFYNLYNSLNIEGDIDSTLYTSHAYTGGDDWYSLSQRYYNDIRLYWIILVANNIINPFAEINPGAKLKILKAAVVSNILSQLKS